MDIHKPKPWHGAREFLKEYLIIVVGVLTALAAEAVVEQLHWRHLADQHEAELNRSAQTIAAYAVQQLEVRRCLHDGVVGVAEALRKPSAAWKGLNPAASGGPAEYLPRDMTFPGHPWPQAAWESALSDGTLSHIPAARFRAYAALYRTSHDINAQQDPLWTAEQELTPLAFDQSLSADQKARYLTALAKADRLEALMSRMSRTMLTSAAQDGFWPSEDAVKFVTDLNRQAYGDTCILEVKRADFLPGGAMSGPAMPGAR